MENEINRLTPQKRERKGRAICNVVNQKNNKLEDDNTYRFVKKERKKFDINEINIGDVVLVAKQDERRVIDNSIQGEVIAKSEYHIDIKFLRVSNFIRKGFMMIHKYTNETTYKVQKKAISDFASEEFQNIALRKVLLQELKPRLDFKDNLKLYDNSLNDTQKLAVKNSNNEKDIFLIQGPPGTGKTKTAVEIIRQHLKHRKRILVCADSNIAVDNLLERCAPYADVLRMGHSAKMLESVEKHSISNVIKTHIKYPQYDRHIQNIRFWRQKQADFTHPSPKHRRGMSDFQIIKNAERGQSMFGVDKSTMHSMAEWIKLQQQIRQTMGKLDKLKQEIETGVISNADVIFATNTASNKLPNNFDVVIIDEAGQSTENSCLVPITKAKKVILIGDHKQLPPTILSKEAKDLEISLFERMIGKVRSVLLDTSYRMLPVLTDFSSQEFYNGELHSAVKNDSSYYEGFEHDKEIIFINVNSHEEKHGDQSSYFNSKEQDKIFDLVVSYPKTKIKGEDIGIISPYLEQVRQLSRKFMGFEIKTVDGFQGREKPIIIISLVRSNKKGNLGFLTDYRRLNVAITRAQKQLVILGNAKTLEKDPVYGRLLEYVKEKGKFLS